MKYSHWLKFVISVGLIGAIIWQIGGVNEIGAVINRIDLLITMIVLLVITLDRALMTFKWVYLLRSHGEHLAFLRGMKIYCASAMWGFVLPSTLGSDAIRVLFTTRIGLDSKTIVASIIVERMVGFIAALILGLIALGLISWMVDLDERFIVVWWCGALLLVITILAFAISFSNRLYKLIYEGWFKRFSEKNIVRRLRRLHETYMAYRVKKEVLVTFFGLTFFEQLFSFVIGWLVAIALDVNVSLVFLAGAIQLAFLISRLPISIDGIGVFEAVFIFLMTLVGVTPAEAISIAFTARILQLVAWLPWWLAYMLDTNQFGLKAPKGES